MDTIKNTALILDELREALSNVSENELSVFRDAIGKASRIFVAGTGRSLLMIRGFAMRLMQTGYESFVVGETTTPAIREGDLLVVASGSGETGTLKIIATGAKKAGATIILLTTAPHSSLGQLADHVVTIPTSTPKADNGNGKSQSIQLGASTFEQSVLLLCDALMIDLGAAGKTSERNKNLMKLHANLE